MLVLELPSLRISKIVAIQSENRLVLINRHPAPEEVDVPLNTTITLEIVDLVTDGVDRDATQIHVNGTLAFDADIQPGFDGPHSGVHQTADTLGIVLDPLVPFESQAAVEVRVVSSTVGGAYSIDETYSFQVEDRTAPRVTAAQATGQKTVKVGFDEEVVVFDPLGFHFEPMDLPAVPISPQRAYCLGNVIKITLNTEMTPDVRYRLTAQEVPDLNENPVLTSFDTAEFVGFRPARPQNRRFDLWQMLPKHNRRSDDTGDLKRFFDCLQEVTDLLLAEVDRFSDIFDIERAPETFLDFILQDLGNPFVFDLDALGKRRLAAILVDLYKLKGTAIGIKNTIRFFLGLEVEILPFTADTMSLGESEFGVDWILGPSNRFALYAFNVRVDQVLTDTQRKQIRDIVNLIRPSHTHFVDLIEPGLPPSLDMWELGISELGKATSLF
ncbi:MAG: phage tail protein [Myxococcota bacterium]|nr:phage tail protein [Myxococcota bacterium]